MDTPSFKEDHISQIPKLRLLVTWGCVILIKQNLHNIVDSFIVQKRIKHEQDI